MSAKFSGLFFDRETVLALAEVGIIACNISDGHWRISANGRKVDYWPSSTSCYEPNPPKGKSRIAGKKTGLQFLVDALLDSPALVAVEIPTMVVEQSPMGTTVEVCDIAKARRLDIAYCESKEITR